MILHASLQTLQLVFLYLIIAIRLGSTIDKTGGKTRAGRRIPLSALCVVMCKGKAHTDSGHLCFLSCYWPKAIPKVPASQPESLRPSTSYISHQTGFTFPEPSSFNMSLTPSHPGHSEDVTAGKENIPPRARSDVLPGTGLSPGAAVSLPCCARGEARPGCFSVILLGEATFCWGVSAGNGWFAACAR